MQGKAVSAAMAPQAAEFGLPLLIALAALGAAAMNLLLPVLPLLQDAFGADYHAVQSGLTSFLVGSAAAQVAVGPLTERYGCGRILVLALLAFCLGSAIAALAPGHEFLAIGRLLQGVGGATSLALAEAAAAETSDDATLVRRIGYLNAGMAAAVLIAPVTGAAIGAALGWRVICWVAFAAGIVLFVLCWRAIDAMPAPRPAPVANRNLAARLLRSRGFVGHSLCAGFVMVNYFSLAAFGPHIGTNLLGLSHHGYGLLFAGLGIGYIAGNLASPWLCKHYGRQRATTVALSIGIAAGLTGTLLVGASCLDTVSFLAVGFVIAAVTGTVLPSAAGAALNSEPTSLGAAAGLLNFAIFGIGAAVTHFVGGHIGTSAAPAMATLPLVTAIALAANLAAGASQFQQRGDTP
jgi:DHA1 family bicyclomycin/chloramphenicol resistance-like MFS transporter